MAALTRKDALIDRPSLYKIVQALRVRMQYVEYQTTILRLSCFCALVSSTIDRRGPPAARSFRHLRPVPNSLAYSLALARYCSVNIGEPFYERSST
jgi:hypothetical protein